MYIDEDYVSQISIPFTREEWDMLHWALTDATQDTSIWWGDEALANALNIIDRIEKNLGVE